MRDKDSTDNRDQVRHLEQISLNAWTEQFNKLTVKYISSINWDTVIWNGGEIAQAAGDIQFEAFHDISKSDADIANWEFYEDSCDARTFFQRTLQEKWEETLSARNIY